MRKLAQEEFALQYVTETRKKDPGIGGVKLWHMYKRSLTGGNPMGRDRFEALIDEHGLKLRRRMHKPRTTDSTHGLPLYPNLVRQLIPTAANQLWVSDITYIPISISATQYTFCYLSMVLDAYTKMIIGWSVGPTLDTKYPLEALEMALSRIRDIPPGELNLIHHSDRGVQYASKEYTGRLKDLGIKISMTESGDPKDNSMAERINETMKDELLKDKTFTSMNEAITAVRKAVDFYNRERPHMSLDMKTPEEAASLTGKMPKRWTSYREKAINAQLALQQTANAPLTTI
jgi:putative transposase